LHLQETFVAKEKFAPCLSWQVATVDA
jgi:hypothetical protein